MMNRVPLLVCLLAVLAVAQTPPRNLLVNGHFAEAKDRRPVGWRTPTGHVVEVDVEDRPSGAGHSLKVTIHKVDEGDAAVTQDLRDVPKNSRLRLAGQMKGSDLRLGYLQVTLKQAGRVVAVHRTDWNTDDWKPHAVEFDTGDADELVVGCSFVQASKAMDQKIRFADVSLTAVSK